MEENGYCPMGSEWVGEYACHECPMHSVCTIIKINREEHDEFEMSEENFKYWRENFYDC